MEKPVPGWDGKPPQHFSVGVRDDLLADLKRRLQATRWPDTAPGSNWEHGTDLAYLRELCAYWAEGYDWRKQEAGINTFKQYKATIDGIGLHFVHERGEGDSPAPILLTHGWPGSFYEFHRLIPLLTHPSRFGGDPKDAFSVVVPSMPGYGFSFSSGQKRFGVPEIADAFLVLMRDVLGYRRFAAHGHDWGSFVSTRLGYAYPDHVDGIHITLLAVPREPAPAGASEEERRFQAQLANWLKEETGYSLMMATKPQTLAYALTDSPAGLAAWIVEKFRSWSDCDGDIDGYFGRDMLLTNIMLYWVTGAIGSAFWPYYARHHEPWIVPPGEKVMVPLGYAEFPREILTPPRSIAEKVYGNIQRWTKMNRGGHFAALEDPVALAHELRAFFGALKDSSLR